MHKRKEKLIVKTKGKTKIPYEKNPPISS